MFHPFIGPFRDRMVLHSCEAFKTSGLLVWVLKRLGRVICSVAMCIDKSYMLSKYWRAEDYRE